MDIFYIFHTIDTLLRIFIVVQVFLIYLKLRIIDKDFLRSITYLNFDLLKSAFNNILILSPFFLIASFLEYPEFDKIYGDEIVHLLQDSLLFVFQIGVIYFLAIVHKVLNFPEP